MMMLNAAGLGFLGPEHLAQCCAPAPEVPTWFTAAHEEAAGRAEAAAVAQAEAFLAQRSTVALYERVAPDPLGVPVRRGRAEPADGAIPARREPVGDSDGDGDDGADNSGDSNSEDAGSSGSSVFECSMMALDDSMVAP